MTVNQHLGRIRNERGAQSEMRTVDAINLAELSLSWIKGARRSPELDADGVDIIVATDVGDLYLQVKSSKRGAREFKQKNPNRQWIGVVVASGSMVKLVNRVSQILSDLRGRIIQKRNASK